MKGSQIREKIAALVCLTSIALVAMGKLTDPENIVINVVVAIAAFISGGSGRKNDTNLNEGTTVVNNPKEDITMAKPVKKSAKKAVVPKKGAKKK